MGIPLGWVRRDDFEVTPLAERKEGVLRAASGMNAAESGADTKAFFDEAGAAIEITAAELNVVEKRGNIGRCPADARSDHCTSRYRKEEPPRKRELHIAPGDRDCRNQLRVNT